MKKIQTTLFYILTEFSKVDYLRNFLEETYSIELLLFLYEHKKISGIENLYTKINFPKKKYPTFRTYIYYLHDRNCLNIVENPRIRREKIISLTTSVIFELDTIFDNYK